MDLITKIFLLLTDTNKPEERKRRMNKENLQIKTKSKKHRHTNNVFVYHRQVVCRTALLFFWGQQKIFERICQLKCQSKTLMT